MSTGTKCGMLANVVMLTLIGWMLWYALDIIKLIGELP